MLENQAQSPVLGSLAWRAFLIFKNNALKSDPCSVTCTAEGH